MAKGHAALIGLVEKLGTRKGSPPEFADEGPPEQEEERGAGTEDQPDSEHGEEAPPSSERDGYEEHAEMALDDLADVIGVSPDDRGDFASALKAYVHACIAQAMGDEHGEESEDEEQDEEREPEEQGDEEEERADEE